MSTTLEAPATTPEFERRSAHAHRSSNGRGKLLLAALVVLGVIAAGYFALGFLSPAVSASQDYVLYDVKRQDMDVRVVERGSLESANNTDLFCEVEARSQGGSATTILWIIKEGTEVRQGDKLVELDAGYLQDQVTQQQIKVEKARADLTKAETDLQIQKSQNDSDIQTAQIAVDLAVIDLKKYVEGDYEQEKRNDIGDMKIAEEDLTRAKDRLAFSERLNKKNYVSDSEVEADRLAVSKAENTLNVAKEKLRVLEEYTKVRQITDLTSKRDEALRKLDRVKNEAKAKEAQAEAALLAQKLTTKTEENTYQKLQRQLDKCILHAPKDGMVVYANDPTAGMRGQPQIQIEEGANLRQGQKIIRLPELGSMQVNVKVHEAKVSHVHAGQPARVRVESMPDKTFPGTVQTVATTADPQSWFSAGVQLYTTLVSIDGVVDGLKPGMTAEVEIMAERLPSVLTVPVQAVVERQGQNYCYVTTKTKKTPELRRVVLGGNNDKMAAIKEGIQEGETVIENLVAVIDEEQLGRVAKEDAAKYAPAKPEMEVAVKPKPSGPLVGNGNGVPAVAKSPAGPGGATGAPGAGSPRPGGGGPGGGFQIPETGADWIKASDKNGDGKVAKDELPEMAQQWFSTMDTNGDGFVDLAEADALIARLKQMRQQGGPGGGGTPGGPQ